MTRDEFNDLAWRDFVIWAWNDDEVVAQFELATGTKFSRPTSGLEAMIDDATGYHETISQRFVFWVTKELWGEEEAPESVRIAMQGNA